MDEEKVLKDLNTLFRHLEDSKNLKITKKILIYKENMGFFKEAISSGRINFQKVHLFERSIYMDVSDFTTEDIEILKEYKDYLILLNDD